MTIKNHDLVDIDVDLVRQTENAFLVKDDKDKEHWLPKSQVEHNGGTSFTMPEWLAVDRGLV